MSGETNLSVLLSSMQPELSDVEYVFCTFVGQHYGDRMDLNPIVSVVEEEGLTLIIPRSVADEQSIDYDSVMKKITLKVHSSLEAVGLTAAFASVLGEHNISANVVAGFYHDHIFVQSDRADSAMAALKTLSQK